MATSDGGVTAFSDAVRDMLGTYHSGPEGVRECGTWWKVMFDKYQKDPDAGDVLISVIGSLAVWLTHYHNAGDDLPKLLEDQYEPVRQFIPELMRLAASDPHNTGREAFGEAIKGFLATQPAPYSLCLYGALLDLLEPAVEEAKEDEGGMYTQAAEVVWDAQDHEARRVIWDALPDQDGELSLQMKVLMLIAARAIEEGGSIPPYRGMFGSALEFVAFQLGLAIPDHLEVARGIATGFLMTCPREHSHMLANFLVDHGKSRQGI